jgi:hypothetical protein
MVGLRHRLSVKPAVMMLPIWDFSPWWGRVYQMVGLRRGWLMKPAPTNVCRGGFYEEYLIPANNLYKPAPTNVCRGGFYEEYLIPANNLYKPAPTQIFRCVGAGLPDGWS